jgi:twitching motility protein PilT
MMDVISLLRLTGEKGASDLHLIAYSPPLMRIHGSLSPVDNMPSLTPEDLEQAFGQLTSDREKQEFERNMELDFAYAIPEVARFRCNVARQRGTISLVIRRLSLAIPTLEELSLPEVCKDLILKPRGLIVISGPTGSGKSTTLAAMIDYLNSSRSCRLVTIEDPVEYVYTSRKCTVTQRELGSDTISFAEALRHVLRQDPDVILVGEMRDLETAAAVLTTAETGHLVLTTGHAPSAPQSIERIVDLFPPHERHLAQSRLASLLLGVLCQTLVPRADGNGRVAAVEIMLGNPAVKNLIREGKIHQLPNIMRTHTQFGMGLLDQSLAQLYRKKMISYDSLLATCNEREEVMRLTGNVAGAAR